MKAIILALAFLLGNYGIMAQEASNRYIVVLKEGASLQKNMDKGKGREKKALKIANSYVVKLNKHELEELNDNDDVESIEVDRLIYPSEATNAWHLDRIDQANLPWDGFYNYTNTGVGVTAYVIDSGINFTHTDFEGRASLGVDLVFDGQNGDDCFGHGTHVAGLIGSRTYGVAKQVQLKSVRIGSCSGSTYVSTLIDGIDWVASNGVKPAVANLSYSITPKSAAADRAVKALVRKGISLITSSGNNGIDACNVSPSSAVESYSVSAIGSTDIRWSGSNYGACVDNHAPGIALTSLTHADDFGTAVKGGTSMAAPVVAGAFAKYLQNNPTATPAQVASFISSTSTMNVLTNIPSGEVNNLLFSN